MCGKLDADVGQFVLQAPAHRPVELAHEGQVAGFLGRQRRGAQALQVLADHRHPGVLGGGQLLAEALDTFGAVLLEDHFGLLGIAREVVAIGFAEEVGAALQRQAPGPDQPGQQQAEADLQRGKLPQQRMATHQWRSASTRM